MSTAINDQKIAEAPSTNVADLIAELASVGHTILQQRADKKAAEETERAASFGEAKATANKALGLPLWMEAYLDVPELETDEWPTYRNHRTVRLPDCAPIRIERGHSVHNWQSLGSCYAYWADDATWDEGNGTWVPAYQHGPTMGLGDIGAVVYVAQMNGQTHAYTMAKIEILNSEGRRPAAASTADDPSPAIGDAPDTVAQAGELLRRFVANDQWLAPKCESYDDDRTVLVASLLFAIADQAQRIADSLEAKRYG